jgi:chromosome segregation ATPase
MAKNIAVIDQRLTSVEERLSSLEDKVDSRLKETRPIWESVQQQLRKLDKKFDLVIKDLFELRSDVANHDQRIGNLEQRILAS